MALLEHHLRPLDAVTMIPPRKRFHCVLEQPFFEHLHCFGVVLFGVQLLVLTFQNFAQVQEGAHVESRVVSFSIQVDHLFNFRGLFLLDDCLFVLFGPVLHLSLLFLERLHEILLEDVRLEHSFLKNFVFQHEFFDHAVAKSELVDTVLEVFLLH